MLQKVTFQRVSYSQFHWDPHIVSLSVTSLRPLFVPHNVYSEHRRREREGNSSSSVAVCFLGSVHSHLASFRSAETCRHSSSLQTAHTLLSPMLTLTLCTANGDEMYEEREERRAEERTTLCVLSVEKYTLKDIEDTRRHKEKEKGDGRPLWVKEPQSRRHKLKSY